MLGDAVRVPPMSPDGDFDDVRRHAWPSAASGVVGPFCVPARTSEVRRPSARDRAPSAPQAGARPPHEVALGAFPALTLEAS